MAIAPIDISAIIVALWWPLTVAILVFAYRNRLRRLLTLLERRIAAGHNVAAFGFSLETPASAPLPIAASKAGAAVPQSLRALLRLSDGGSALLAIGEISMADETPVTGTGDALALAVLQATVLRIPDLDVVAAVVRPNETVRELLETYSSVVSIGGPRSNRLTSVLMGANHLTLEFRPGGVYDRKLGKLNLSEFTPDGRKGTDWAIITVTGNPRNEGGTTVVLAGYSGYGTNAAALILATHESLAKNTIPFEALVRLEIEDGQVQKPNVEFVRSLPVVEKSHLSLL